MSEIKNCPFCGSRPIGVIRKDSTNTHQMFCQCGSKGPNEEERIYAEAAWNTRAPQEFKRLSDEDIARVVHEMNEQSYRWGNVHLSRAIEQAVIDKQKE